MPQKTSFAQFDHFIPISTSRLIKKLELSGLSQQQIQVIYRLKQIITYQFSQQLMTLKQLYQPFNPDRELLLGESLSSDSKSCIETIKKLLSAANYTELNRQQIEYALERSSPYGLDVQIDFEQFDNVSLFYRGKSQTSIEVRDWKWLYLKKKTVSLIRYQRLFLLLQYRDQQNKPGIHLKLFKDILRPDLEMLFPECKIHMKMLDKLKLAVTGGGGTAGGLFATIGKVTAAVNPWAIVMAVTGFAALIWRQVSKVFIQKTRYMATLAQNLYFNNLDNNAGAITYLIDLARQEEIKETILAYALLNLESLNDTTQLDSACEQWILETFDCAMDFDISDAVRKLKAFDIILDNEEQLRCKQVEEILPTLDRQWRSFIENPSV
ncbi:MAG: DUF3754 domain-containing protein [Candidatus Thiodiazotropha sp. (ex Lucinoma borealis)]|nr:DUF3754 domain-containing protein [Candidatus Thiodiazotropha sp. (ex Lucinoma borealis)]